MQATSLVVTLLTVVLSSIMATQTVSAKETNPAASAQSGQALAAHGHPSKAKPKKQSAKPMTPSATRSEFRKLEKPLNETDFRQVPPVTPIK
jgi:hypothetical protein